MSVVFDTNVLLSSTLWDGSVSQKLLFRIIRSDVKIFLSADILSEYRRILRRDFDYSDDEAVQLMEKILSFATLVKPVEKIDVVKEDFEDNKVIECAVASSSDYIITYDRHLLNFGKFRGIRIITPEEALRFISSP